MSKSEDNKIKYKLFKIVFNLYNNINHMMEFKIINKILII